MGSGWGVVWSRRSRGGGVDAVFVVGRLWHLEREGYIYCEFVDLERSFGCLEECPRSSVGLGEGGSWCAGVGWGESVTMVAVCGGALTVIGTLDGVGDSFGVKVGLHW